jgi:hypothetical protein
LVFVSMQPEPHSIWPATEHPQIPALQAAPTGQVVPQPPQLSGSFPFVTTHAPFEQVVVPAAQLELQAPALQTCPAWQAAVQLLQWLLSGVRQTPLHASSPAAHWQDPLWQVWPAAHTLPHAPQFWGSDAAFTH